MKNMMISAYGLSSGLLINAVSKDAAAFVVVGILWKSGEILGHFDSHPAWWGKWVRLDMVYVNNIQEATFSL